MKKRILLLALFLGALVATASAVQDGDPPPLCIPGQICN